jgi:hypothetical protein
VRALLRRIIRVVQRAVIAFLLFWVYFVGLPLTLVVIRLFDRSLLARTPAGQASYWCEARGYEPDLADARRQT